VVDKRVVFMGTPMFSVPILSALSEQFKVLAVVTQPDKPTGRGRKITYSQVKQFAVDKGLLVLQPKNLKEPTIQNRIKGLNPDVIVVAAYGKILPKHILEIPENGCVNVHASLLPRWRGASPIQSAILNGDEITGVTIMLMNEGMDTGDVLRQSNIDIEKDDTAKDLSEKLSNLGAKLLIDTMMEYLSGKISPTPQDDQQATYSRILRKKDGLVDFDDDAELITRKIRAFNPWPVCYFVWKNQKIRIYRADVSLSQSLKPGERDVLKKYPAIGTKTSDLIIKEIQPPGRQVMSGREFLNGARDWNSKN
jgi:methionyl-tRNA formyltransferase